MSEDLGRRRSRRGVTRRVGDPNVLSDAATPNVLSGTVSGTSPRPTDVPMGAPAGSDSRLGTGTTAARPRVRLPSFGTVIFLGFLAITAFRLLGEFIEGLARETPSPTVPGLFTPSSGLGVIEFGTKSDGDCGVLETGLEFQEGANVWWSARMSIEQGAEESVVVIVRRDGAEVDREDVPPDPDVGAWTVLCSGAPVVEADVGVYRVEVWDAAVTTLRAAGEYRLTPS